MNALTVEVAIVTGLAVGSVYALIGLSFNLVIAATGFVNFAIETLVSVGGIAAYLMLNSWHVPVLAAIVAIAAGGLVLGALLDLVARRTVDGRVANVGRAVLLATVGISVGADALATQWFGGSARQVKPYISPVPIKLGNIPVPPSYIIMIAVLLAAAAILELVLRATSTGRQLRALQEDRAGAELAGINVNAYTTVIFAISGGLAALSGFLITPISFASASAGSTLIIPAFAGVALGGFGSLRGGIAGGLLAGLVGSLVPLWLPPDSVDPILLGLIAVVLLAWPNGLLGARALREV
jgi:branched-chain amino acid transport system permease protein